jgi:lipopolysaccharide transport system ATP-binding protein
MSDTVISVEHIYKQYRLGVIGTGTFKDDLKVWSAKLRGKPNPLAKIGETDYGNRSGDTIMALEDVSFTVQQGEALGIIGRNGAGKSTLLKILSRVTTPTSGKIKVKGRIASLLEVGTGFHPELTGRENIFLNGAILGMTRAEVTRKFDEIVDFSGVEKFIDTPVKRYSSGMYVRLAFAVAAHLDPEILIVDEVLAVGDAEFQKKCLGKMGDVASEGRTVLFVSHNMAAIEQLCNTCLLIDHGKETLIQSDVKYVINTYIGCVNNRNIESEWINHSLINENPIFYPHRFAITDNLGKTMKMPVSYKDNLWITIEGFIKEYYLSLQIGFCVYNENNQIVYISYQTDAIENAWPHLQLGNNILRAPLITNIINEGFYRIQLLVALYQTKWIYSYDNSDINIYMHIMGVPGNSPYWLDKRKGIITPVIQWQSD